MNRLRNDNDLGLGAVGLILVVVVLVAVAATGWVVYSKHHKDASVGTSSESGTKKSATKPPVKTVDPTANWVKVDSVGGAYSIKVPDGWELTNYPGNVLNGDRITFSEGKPAIITTGATAYAGDERKINVGFTDKQYPAPQWQSPIPYGTEATTDFSIGSLTGKRYSIEYTQTVTGVTKGDKISVHL